MGTSELLAEHTRIIDYLRSPDAVRERCGVLFERARNHQLQHFDYDVSQLNRVADYVIEVIQENYPDLDIPFHSRWRHFESGGIPRVAHLEHHLTELSALEIARIKFDLAIVSVLLDAGAGAEWRYIEPETQRVIQRSEGLAIASFHMFCQGLFSSNPDYPFQVDGLGLQQLTQSRLADGFQATDQNPLVGIAGRLNLLHQLGHALHQHPDLFGQPTPRLGNLVDYLRSHAVDHRLPARDVLRAVLDGFSDIWSGRLQLFGVNLGDVWVHSALSDAEPGGNLVPFHKLSQWLTYSLLEPLQDSGLQITHLDDLTGLPEYRNGGLCIDLGLIQPKHEGIIGNLYRPESEVIVEWRSLTVIALDAIADVIRQKLNLSANELPLAKVLQGGTWSAGRKIAAHRRPGGIPPIQLDSDGTVF
ncbi:MAG: URC4/urg3 family protein [Elainellaceae cyanobacterium]